MWRLIGIEFHKLRYNRAAKILIISYFGLMTSVALLASIKFDIGNVHFHLAEQGIFNFPYIWHLNTYLAAIIKFFLLLVIVSMTAGEYTNRTLKQNLIDGLSKKEFILSKFIMVLILALLSTVFITLISLILGFLYSDFTSPELVLRGTSYLLAYFIKLTAFFSFGLFAGLLIKRSAFAIGFILLWSILEGIFTGLMRWNWKLENYETIAAFFPLNNMSNLIKEPFSRLKEVKSVASQLGNEIVKDYSVHGTDILIAVVWTSIFIYLSYSLLSKRDL